MIIGLIGYKPTEFTLYPDDCKRIIDEYSHYSNVAVIRIVATSFAEAANSNRALNNRKSTLCNYVFCLLIVGAIAFIIYAVLMIIGLGVPSNPVTS
jgi:hypothetical protein